MKWNGRIGSTTLSCSRPYITKRMPYGVFLEQHRTFSESGYPMYGLPAMPGNSTAWIGWSRIYGVDHRFKLKTIVI